MKKSEKYKSVRILFFYGIIGVLFFTIKIIFIIHSLEKGNNNYTILLYCTLLFSFFYPILYHIVCNELILSLSSILIFLFLIQIPNIVDFFVYVIRKEIECYIDYESLAFWMAGTIHDFFYSLFALIFGYVLANIFIYKKFGKIYTIKW